MKFDYVIGNPAYQGEEDKNGRKPPVYQYFIEESYKVGYVVELITPARFLFNAGQTPKEWNRKMLNDQHVKVLEYEPNGANIFPNTLIRGGVVITYMDKSKTFEPIKIFIPYKELKTIVGKVTAYDFSSLSVQVIGAVPYKFSNAVKSNYPQLVNVIGKSFDLRSNVFEKKELHKIFHVEKPANGDFVAIYGIENKKRTVMWIARELLEVPTNFTGYKLLIAKAFGGGDYGEPIGEMQIAPPNSGHTQSFVSIGNYKTTDEANNLTKYLKSKFARALLGLLKVTQDVTPRVWEFVPIQDFTLSSDIDWSQSIANIDKQLYKKYGLSDEEINFIESHVQEME